MEEILSSMTTAFSTIKSDATSAIATGVAAALPVMGLLLAVRLGVRAFKSASK